MKKIILGIVMIIFVGAIAIVAEASVDRKEALQVEEAINQIFNPYGLKIEAKIAHFNYQDQSILYSFCVYNENAKYRLLSKRDRVSAIAYAKEGENFILIKKGGKFTPISNGVKKTFFGEKELFMELKDLHKKIPAWGIQCYEVEVKISLFKEVKIITAISSVIRCARMEFLVDQRVYMKKEEQACLDRLKKKIEKIIGK